MFSVALIGPDGAGKTTIGRRIEHTLSLPVKYVYMGVNLDSSNIMLPTTRLVHMLKRRLGAEPDVAGPPDPDRRKPKPKGILKRVLAGTRASLRLVNRLGEEWFRQLVAWRFQRRCYVVLFDRHFFSDYYTYDIASKGADKRLSSRIHGWLLEHAYPKPDLVIYLDAPAEVLFARKGEGGLELLERRRQDYLKLRDLVDHFAIVDASLPEDDVARAVTETIENFHRARLSETGKMRASRG